MIKIEPVYENDNSILMCQVCTLEMKPAALAAGTSGITLGLIADTAGHRGQQHCCWDDMLR
jgi:hypothetical protein